MGRRITTGSPISQLTTLGKICTCLCMTVLAILHSVCVLCACVRWCMSE